MRSPLNSSIDGLVTVDNSPEKHTLLRFCRKRISRWINERGLPSDGADFHVSLSRENEAGDVSCETEISIGLQTWRGYDLAPDLQSAFIHSLKRLQPH